VGDLLIGEAGFLQGEPLSRAEIRRKSLVYIGPRNRFTVSEGHKIKRRRSAFSDAFILAVKLYIVNELEKRMPRGMDSILYSFVALEKWLAQNEYAKARFDARHLDENLVERFNRHLMRTSVDGCHNRLTAIRGFYAWGVNNDYEGFDRLTLRKMKAVKVKSRARGKIARMRDPVRGAFEYEEITQLVRAFELGTGDVRARASAQLLYELGIRPAAAVLLRRRHLRPSPDDEKWFIDVPRVKGSQVTRDVTRRQITARLANLLLALLPDDTDGGAYLLGWLGYVWPQRDLNKSLAAWADEIGLETLRLGNGDVPQRLPVTSYRFRYTLATRMAEMGAGPEEIAAMLDDKSLAMAAVYVNFSSNIVEILARTLDRHPAWYRIMDLFRGVVATEADINLPAVYGGVPHFARFSDLAPRIDSIGGCGKVTPCTLVPPLSCYGCEFFKASSKIDRHKAQLLQLQAEIDSKIGVESDRMADVLKDSVFAILTLIAKLKADIGGSEDEPSAASDVMAAIRVTRTGIFPSEGSECA
jgi:integrase